MAVRTLYILRHAHSDILPGVEDRDRPLSPAGRQDAQALAMNMREKNYRPDAVICSSAARTKETAEIVCPHTDITFLDALYLAGTGTLFHALQQTPDEYASILLVAHNPGIHALVQMLADPRQGGLLGRIAGGYPAGCLSVFECACGSWTGIQPGENALADIL